MFFGYHLTIESNIAFLLRGSTEIIFYVTTRIHKTSVGLKLTEIGNFSRKLANFREFLLTSVGP
jgi:hypothetical protein